MAKSKYKHNNFSAGQYDREFTGQESPIHSNGMSYCSNVLSSAQGELKSRPGTEWKADLGSQAVIIPFRRAESDLALVFTDSALDIKEFNDSGDLQGYKSSQVETMAWANTANDTPSTTAVSVSGDILDDNKENFYKSFTQNTDFLVSNYSTCQLTLKQSTGSITTNPTTYFNMHFDGGKIANKIIALIIPTGSGQTFTAAGWLMLPYHQNWILNVALQYSDDGVSWSTQKTEPFRKWLYTRPITSTINKPVVGITFFVEGASSHPNWRVAITWDWAKMTTTHSFMVCLYNGAEFATESEPETIESPYTAEQLKNLKYTQQNNEMYITDGTHNPYKFYLNGVVPSFTEQNFSFLEGQPCACRFFQNRLWFGGFTGAPTRVRGSEFDDHTNFTVVTTNVKATDPILTDCNQFSERISDLWGGFNVLYAQSPDGIAFIEAAGDAVAPNRMNFTLKSYERASGITPIMKENIMFYVGLDKQSIYAFSYDNNIQQFVAPNVSEYWQEVLKDKVSELHFVPTRNDNILGVLENGKMFSMLYSENGVGYFPVDVGGQVYDISVLKHNDDIDAYIVVNRNDNWTIEKYHHPGFMQRTDAFLQTTEERNIATKENLIKSPYFDCWKNIKNELLESWSYDSENGTIAPTHQEETVSDLSDYVGKVIRLYYGDNVNDYVEAQITEVYTEADDTYTIDIISGSTDSRTFNKIQLPVESITTDTPIQIQDNGVYLGEFEPVDGVVELESPIYSGQYGYPYKKIAVITELTNKGYLKEWGTVAISLIDTMDIQVGRSMKTLEQLIEFNPDTSFYNSNPIMYNGVKLKNIADTDAYEKMLILYSEKGLPFCVNGLESEIIISDFGGN